MAARDSVRMHERQVARKCQHRRDAFRAGTDQSRMDAADGAGSRQKIRHTGLPGIRLSGTARDPDLFTQRPQQNDAPFKQGRGRIPSQPQQALVPAHTPGTPPRQNDTGDPYHAPSCHWRPQKALPRRLPASIMPAGEAGKSVVDRQPSSLLSFLKIIFGFILCSQSLPDAALERLQAS